ncbi:hypothetical protein M3P21_15635 [Ruegeria sp. 2012CJ41-6]|uniref:Uncharacterized protein n=1 Tax=Ruegeria spongiae TaxID=2942209 RepID=A0ABT0Q524_9RHOB|nr:hypothetical protein [Ruegeria spongiae]MCL6284963.1 hypothetical protein [Ruegeria spongiae]
MKLHPAFEKLGGQIIDLDRFMDEFIGDIDAELISNMRQTIAAAYQELMTEEEIHSVTAADDTTRLTRSVVHRA